MKKICLVKKDPSLPAGEENWRIMTGREFAAFLRTEEGRERRRSFGRLDPLDGEDVCIFAECGEEEARRWNRRRARGYYLRAAEAEACGGSGPASAEEDGPSGETEPADPDCDVEKAVLRDLELESLRAALGSLKPEELDLIRDLYLRDPPLTGAACAAALGVSPQALQKRKRRILRKLREKMEAGGRGLPEKGEDPGTGVRRR